MTQNTNSFGRWLGYFEVPGFYRHNLSLQHLPGESCPLEVRLVEGSYFPELNLDELRQLRTWVDTVILVEVYLQEALKVVMENYPRPSTEFWEEIEKEVRG